MYSGITKIYDRKTVGHIFTNFFLWGYVKDRLFIPPLTRDLADLKAAVKNIDAPMLTCVWQELEYCIVVCRVTRGAHIEHL
jgi:hypothetical protein